MTELPQRLFVALELPAVVRAALAGWAAAAAPPPVRCVPERNLHVTMAFLASCSAQTAGAVTVLLASLARPLGALGTAAALWLPPRRPGVLAVAVRCGPDLLELHADLVAALTDAIGLAPERRAFTPHVTVGRLPRATPMPAQLASAPPVLEFHVPALELWRSHTGSGGARYESLARASLTARSS